MPRNPHNSNNPHVNCGPIHTPTSASENIKLQVMMNKLENSLKDEFVLKENLKTINSELLWGGGNIDITCIKEIKQTASDPVSLIDTYTIYFNNGETFSFEVTNGKDGRDGLTGEIGPQGPKGQDGIGIKETKILDGELVITYTDDTSVILGHVVGTNGTDGKDGADGRDGQDGISINSANIDVDGNLVLTLSNNTTTVVGKVVGENGLNGTNGKSAYDLAKENGYQGTLTEWLNSLKGEKGNDGTGISLKANREDCQAVGDAYIINDSKDADYGHIYILTNLNPRNFEDGGEIKGPKGDAGVDGREVEFQVTDTAIQWRYKTGAEWTDLVALKDLKGADGKDGIDGKDGNDGLNGVNGIDGKDGREISLRVNETVIQWRYEDQTSNWTNLIDLDQLKGADGQNGIDGRSVELQINSGFIQWRLSGEATWENLLSTDELKLTYDKLTDAQKEELRGERGPRGYGIVGILPGQRDGLKQTYEIHFSDGEIRTFDVYDGAKGATGDPGKDGLPIAIKIGNTTYAHENGLITLPTVATKDDINAAIADLVDSAPEALNTLNELAVAIENHEDAYGALLETVGNKADKEHVHTDYALKEHTHEQYITEHQDISGKADINHRHDDLYDAKGAAEAVKNELLNGAGDAFDTLKELGDLISENADTIEVLTQVAAGKADKEHTHDQYLTEHQSLDNYYTKSEVDTKIPSLDGYAKTEDIPTDYLKESDLEGYSKFSGSYNDLTDKPEIPSIEGLASEDFVKDEISKIEFPKTDLTGYYNKEEVDNLIENVEVDLSDYALKSEIITDYNDLENTPVIPDAYDDTEIRNLISEKADSDHDHDDVYIKEHQKLDHLATKAELENYVTELELNAKGYLIAQDLADKADKSELTSLATKQELQEAIAGIDFPETDLSNYYTKTEVEDKITELATNVDARVGELDDQFSSIYATKTELTTHINNQQNPHNITAEQLDVYTKTETREYVSANIADAVSDLAKKSDIPSIEGLASQTWVESKGYLTSHQDISGKADKTDLNNYYTKEDTHTKFLSVDIAATKEYVDEAIANSGGKSAYEIAVEKGFDGNEGQWLASLKGDKGDKGDTPQIELNGKILEPHESGPIILTFEIENMIAPVANDLSTIANSIYADYATKKYVDDAIDNALTPDKLPEVLPDVLDQVLPNNATTDYVNAALAEKADNIPFTSAKFVTKPVGNFVIGDNVNGLSVAEILAKLLGLSDKDPTEIPSEPDLPEEFDSIVEEIKAKEIPMYSVNTSNELVEIPYNYLNLTETDAVLEATNNGFYQIKDSNGAVIESGYQELQVDNGNTYYVIALPKKVDYNTMVTVKVWDSLENNWKVLNQVDKPALTNDTATVAALCDEAGVDISHIDTTKYTVWVEEDTPTGKKYRFIINK